MTAAAVATASAAACQRHGESEAWRSWFGHAFTKTVRRAKRPAQTAELEADSLVVARAVVHQARAFAYAPMRYDEFPAHLRRLQVSGLDVDRARDADPRSLRSDVEPTISRLDPTVVINKRVEMTTGMRTP